MEFREAFPIAIIDEDYEGKHAAGRGMQQLAAAIEKEGFRVVAGISYADAQRLAKIFNTESCWLVSVDGSEDTKTRWQILEEVLATKRARNDRLPIFLFGDELTAEMVPANVLKHANAFMRLFEDSPEFLARAIARSAQLYLDRLPPPMFKALMDYTFQASYSWHTPGHGGGTAFRKSPVGHALLRVLRREHAALRHFGVGRQGRVPARSHRPDRGGRAKRGAHLRDRRNALRRRRHVHRQQDRLARDGRQGRPRALRSQLPQIHPAFADHDRRHADLPGSLPQRPRDHRADLARSVHAQSPSSRRSRRAPSPSRPAARSG